MKDLTKPELIKRFASIEFNRFLDIIAIADLNQGRQKVIASGDGDRYVTAADSLLIWATMDGLDGAAY